MGDASGEAFRVIARTGRVMDLQYPDCLEKCFIVITPGWVGLGVVECG